MKPSFDSQLPSQQTPFEIRRFLREEVPADFEQALMLRLAVFVKEQGVPEAEERDHHDDEAWHWLMLSGGQPIATARMLAYQEACQMRPVAKIGRVAVSASVRGQGIGERLMREILAFARAEGFDQAIVDAQTQVLGFYQELGFEAEGDEFLDANIPHYRMRLLLSK